MFKIMVVEDDHNARRLMETVLRQNGYEPICASDGIDALEKMELFADEEQETEQEKQKNSD